MTSDPYIAMLLDGWEETFKKGMLSYWILSTLSKTPQKMTEVKQSVEKISAESNLSIDEKSMYRALRRLESADLLTSVMEPSANGPDYKVYSVNDTGKELLRLFTLRNVEPLSKTVL
jgi:PadR family transcriptional regulator, regulatory protein PadR